MEVTEEAMELIEDDIMSDDDDDSNQSSGGSNYEETPNLMDVAMENEVTAQLVAAGKFSLNFIIHLKLYYSLKTFCCL